MDAYPPPSPPGWSGRGWRGDEQDEARQAVRGGRFTPLGRVIEGIGRRTPGRQLDAGLEYQDGRAVYRVLWMTDRGRRMDYIVDAETGRILGVE
ncbi:MAG: PepSY domain-containing protein [Caulobacteraceae bacterium]